MGIAPAGGAARSMTGHGHPLADVDTLDLNEPIASDYNPIHLGNGQSEVLLTLKPARHALHLLMGDHAQRPRVLPVMSKKMTTHVR